MDRTHNEEHSSEKNNDVSFTNGVTIKDVAKAAGVSVSAVSKVLRDAYGVSDNMKAKVTAAIEQLGYRPRAAARSMRGKSYSVGIVIPELSSLFPVQVAQSIVDSFEKTGYQPLLASSPSDCGSAAEAQKKLIRSLTDRQVDGLIIISPFMDIEWIENLAETLPTVLVARNGIGAHYDSVTDNAFEGTLRMVDYLIELGHREIAYIGMPSSDLKPPYVLSTASRQEGYERGMTMHGLKPHVIASYYSEQGGYEAMETLMAEDKLPTAVFAGADIAAFGVMRAANEHGISIPNDLTVVGYDNVFASGLHGVGLTTLDQKAESVGSQAAHLLLTRMEGRTEPICRIETPELIIRSSSGEPRR